MGKRKERVLAVDSIPSSWSRQFLKDLKVVRLIDLGRDDYQPADRMGCRSKNSWRLLLKK